EELKRVDGPVFALGFNYVNVSEEQHRLALTGAAIADHKVEFFRIGATEKDVLFGKAGGFEPSGGSFGHGSCGAGGGGGRNLYKLFVDVASELLFRIRASGLSGDTTSDKKK